MQMVQTRRRAQIPFSLGHVDDETGDSVLHLIWAESSEPWGQNPPALRAAQRLAGEAQLLGRLDLLAANRNQETPLMRLAALASESPRRYWYPPSLVIPVPDWIAALPTLILQSWQAARLPRYKSVTPLLARCRWCCAFSCSPSS